MCTRLYSIQISLVVFLELKYDHLDHLMDNDWQHNYALIL